jgi:hypothetical protein
MEVASRIVMGILQASGFGYDGFGGGVDDWLDYEGDDGMGGGGDSIDRWRRRRGSILVAMKVAMILVVEMALQSQETWLM